MGLEVKEIPKLPPAEAIEDEVNKMKQGLTVSPSYPDIPVMVWWTPFTADDGVQQCGEYQCYFTNDRSFRQHPSTRIIFFYGTDFKTSDLPLPRTEYEDWALLHEESPKNNPIFNHQEMMIHFNHSSTFRQESDFPLTTQYLESINSLSSSRYLVPLHTKNTLLHGDLAPVVYVQSGCDTPSMRDQWVEQFMKHVKVDSYGACLNNKQLPDHLQGSEQFESEQFYQLLAQYKFIISAENAVCDDYVTEKLWGPLVLGSVPIYLGAANVRSLLPNNNSAILISDFDSPADVAEYVIKVNNDDDLYKQFLQHKREYNDNSELVTNKLLKQMMSERRWGVSRRQQQVMGTFVSHYQCHVCEKVARNMKFSNRGDQDKSYQTYLMMIMFQGSDH